MRKIKNYISNNNLKTFSYKNDYIIEIHNLKTYFKTIHGIVKSVDDISFNVKYGEIAAIVGESGCGKTATALSILNLIPNSIGKILEGEILFCGKDLKKFSQKEIRKIRGREISMVFQDASSALNPVMTIGQQLTEVIIEHLRTTLKESEARACELLELVGIPGNKLFLKQYPHQLSGGMKQRVMIAIALSCNPKIIIADEPTTSLDVTIQAQILELINKLSNDLGLSFLIITHNLGLVARYAKRINVMYAGRIIEKGDTKEIFYNAIHPYLRGLLSSVPRLDLPRKNRLHTIEGQPPNLISPIKGCAFYYRCKFSNNICKEIFPPETKITENHFSTCWLAEKLKSVSNNTK